MHAGAVSARPSSCERGSHVGPGHAGEARAACREGRRGWPGLLLLLKGVIHSFSPYLL